MKKYMIFAVCLITLALSACNSANVGVIGGADGPTAVYVRKNKGTDYEKDSIKMVRIDGALYYETGRESKSAGKCGTADGSFKKTVGKYEIPQKDNESNFNDANSYQLGFEENTIEICIDDDWEIFKKIDSNSDVLKYKYCCELEGEMPNAAEESTFLVLANEKNITFDDAAYVMFGSNMNSMKDIYVLPLVDD